MSGFFDFLTDHASDIFKGAGSLINTFGGIKANNDQYRVQQQIQDADRARQEELRNYIIDYNAKYDAAGQADAASSAAASARNAAARNAWGAQVAAAKNAEMNNKMAAEKKANKMMNKTFNEVKGVYAPFKDTALATLPKMSHAYDGGLDLLALANDKIKNQTALLEPSKPAYQQVIPDAQKWMITPMLRAMGGR